METKLLKAKQPFVSWIPPFLSYESWKQRYELWKLMNQTTSKILNLQTMIKREMNPGLN